VSAGTVASGGLATTGGVLNAGGATSSGGLNGAGGAVVSGGTVASGGLATTTGGVINAGGTTTTGGFINAGGTATGGAAPSDSTICAGPAGAGAGALCGPSGSTCYSYSVASDANQTYCSHDSWTCVPCTSNDNACVTGDCSDCCSHVFTDGKCIAGPCKKLGNACSGSDCKDCCWGLVGSDGTCVQCNINSDCACPKVCANHQCTCTPNHQPCAYPSKDCQDCCSGIVASGQCLCIPSGTNQLTGTGITVYGYTPDDAGAGTWTFKLTPGAYAACCSGQASSQTACQ
jgi:hypothetical protein